MHKHDAITRRTIDNTINFSQFYSYVVRTHAHTQTHKRAHAQWFLNSIRPALLVLFETTGLRNYNNISVDYDVWSRQNHIRQGSCAVIISLQIGRHQIRCTSSSPYRNRYVRSTAHFLRLCHLPDLFRLAIQCSHQYRYKINK